MLVPINWLKEYVDIDKSVEELADALTLTGSNVETINELGGDIQNVVVGRIEKISPHPNADKLVICDVNIGEKNLQIVTGAPNVEKDQLVPVALDGSILPGGVKIKEGKLRGELSQGMLCSYEELKLEEMGDPEDDIDGILVLDRDYPLGMDIKKALEIWGKVIEFEITSNRPDCLSVVGLAREAAVTLGTKYSLPKIVIKKEIENVEDYVRVKVQDSKGCNRYCARVVKDVRIGPSPRWMRRRLAAAGVRPINNIVDITNYVMLELGQPMHAFDLQKVDQGTIIVRRAQEGETLKTLDEKDRTLTEDMLVIADPKKAIALAGVMGGYNTEITEDTKDIILESASFNGGQVRMTAKALSLRSEASARFEKGVDYRGVERAIDRAAQLIEELEAGTIVKGRVDASAESFEPRYIDMVPGDINKVLGTDMDCKEMDRILRLLSFKTEKIDGGLRVEVPSFRQDVSRMEDLAEEIARIYGYDKIPMTLMENSVARGARTREQILMNRAKNILTSMGLFEAVTYSFYSPRIYERIGFTTEEYPDHVTIKNPLGEDQSVMRTTLIPGILDVLSRNQNRSIEDCRVFEIGNIFIPKALPMNELPRERLTLTIGAYSKDMDFYYLKGILEQLFKTFGIIENIEFVPHRHSTCHPGRTAALEYKGNYIGLLGEIHPDVCKAYRLGSGALIAEIDFDSMLKEAKTERVYKQLPRYPAIERDLAIIIKKEVLAAQIEKTIARAGGELLERVDLFDIYEGDQIPEGHRSIAYSLIYRDPDKTLKDEDIIPIHNRIIEVLEKELGGKLRK